MKRILPFLMFTFAVHAQQLTLTDAIAMALQKNADVVVERESLNIADATILRAEAALPLPFGLSLIAVARRA